jgi:hypothetical protein
MTTLPLLPLAATIGAFATFAAFAVAMLRMRRRDASVAETRGTDDDAVPAPPTDGEFNVPFTHLGVDVEPPVPPDWRAGATGPATPAPSSPPLALDEVYRATAVLHEHVRREPASIATWLVLLELYRTHGREQALAELAQEFHERFRAHRGSDFEAVRGGADGGLEAFPPVMRLVTMLWGTHECRDLLARLARDRSEGRRLGLSRAAYVDIGTLAQLLDELLATLDSDRTEETRVRDAWQRASYVAQI